MILRNTQLLSYCLYTLLVLEGPHVGTCGLYVTSPMVSYGGGIGRGSCGSGSRDYIGVILRNTQLLSYCLYTLLVLEGPHVGTCGLYVTSPMVSYGGGIGRGSCGSGGSGGNSGSSSSNLLQRRLLPGRPCSTHVFSIYSL